MFSYEIVISSSRGYYVLGKGNMCCHRCVPNTAVGGKPNRCCWWQNVTLVKVITIVKPVSITILLVISSAVKPMLIRPCQYIHTALLIYPYGPGKIFTQPSHTDQLDYLIKVLRTGCSRANTADRESIPGSIQKQPVSNTIISDFIVGFSYMTTN